MRATRPTRPEAESAKRAAISERTPIKSQPPPAGRNFPVRDRARRLRRMLLPPVIEHFCGSPGHLSTCPPSLAHPRRPPASCASARILTRSTECKFSRGARRCRNFPVTNARVASGDEWDAWMDVAAALPDALYERIDRYI